MTILKIHAMEWLADEEGGTETLTLCLWFPMIIMLFLYVVDLSFIMFSRANLTRIAEETTRGRSLGLLDSAAAVTTAVRNSLPDVDANQITVQHDVISGIVRTRISVPISEIDAVGLVSGISRGMSIAVLVHQFKEDPEV